MSKEEKRNSPPPPDFVLRGHTDPVTAVRFTPDGANLVSGSQSGEMRIWNMTYKRTSSVFSLKPQVTPISTPTVLNIIAKTNQKIISQSKCGTIDLWEICPGSVEHVSSISTDSCSFCKFAYSCDNDVIASTLEDTKQIGVLDGSFREPEKILKTFRSSKDSGMAMSLIWGNPSGNHLFAGFEDGTIQVFDIRKESFPVNEFKVHSDPITCLDIHGIKGVSGSAGEEISFFEYEDNNFEGKAHKKASFKLTVKKGVNDIRIRSDDKLVVSAGWDYRVRVYALKKPRPLAVLKFHTDAVTSIDFNPTISNTFATASQDTRIALWSLY